MNTQAGYGNASTFGLPATSNLFTVDGMNENDPFLNLNNSVRPICCSEKMTFAKPPSSTTATPGSTGLAGANVNYVTRSGSNKWHGNAEYFWNGRTMNANNYFNVQGDVLVHSSTRISGLHRWVDRSAKIKLSSSSTTRDCELSYRLPCR